jgi:transposase, IS30 family
MNYKHFTIEEREKIQELLWQKASIRNIAKAIDRSPASVSRELQRNFMSGVRKTYIPRAAHKRALEHRKHRGRDERLKNGRIRIYVVTHLKRRWSPEQIAGRIKTDLGEHISHEAIYRFIYHQVCNGSNLTKPGLEDLRPYLRRRRRIRVPHGARKCQRVLKPYGKSIDERPKVVDKRKRIGDWEGDTVESVDHKPGINTVVERKTGLAFITKLTGRSTTATVGAMAYRFRAVPERFKLTVTLDNGFENLDSEAIEEKVDIDCFYAHPYHSWERGTNENTNGLIRDYFPKKTDFSNISNDEIQFVENELNSRPRKRLGWQTPLEAWSVALQG